MCKKSLTSNLRKTKAICVPRLYIFYSVITIEIFVTFWIFSYFCFGHISYSNSGFCLRFSDIAVFEKDAFSFFHEHGTKKKILSPHDEWNLRPSDSALRCSESEGLRFLMGTQNFFFFPCSWRDEKTFFSVSLILLGPSFDFEPLLLLKEYLGVRLLHFFLITGDRIKNKEKLADKQFWQQRICNISPNRI